VFPFTTAADCVVSEVICAGRPRLAASATRKVRCSSTRMTCRSGWHYPRQYAPQVVEHFKTGTRPPFPYSDVRLQPFTYRGSDVTRVSTAMESPVAFHRVPRRSPGFA